MGSAVHKAPTLFLKYLAEVILDDRSFSMDTGVRLERDIAHAVVIFLFFSLARFVLFMLHFSLGKPYQL